MRADLNLPPDEFLRRLSHLEGEWNLHSTAQRAELLSEIARFNFADESGTIARVPARVLELAVARLLNVEVRRILLELSGKPAS